MMRRVRVIGQSVVAALYVLSAEAQTNSGPAQKIEVSAGQNQGEQPGRVENVIPDLLFDGGTVRLLVERLKQEGRKANIGPLNVIVADRMQEEAVPRFELHNVSYADVFLALNKMQVGGQGGGWQLSSGNSEPIWVLNAGPEIQSFQQIDPLTGMPLGPEGPPASVQIYPLQRYLTRFKVEDITTAIQTAWSMVNREKGAQLKYHKDTSLLIAVGSRDQLDIISQVLRSLEETLAAAQTAPVTNVGQEVRVLGAVNKPGAFELSPDENIDALAAIFRAGGLNNRANENKIEISRPGEPEKTYSLKELKKDKIPLKPGDTVEVHERFF